MAESTGQPGWTIENQPPAFALTADYGLGQSSRSFCPWHTHGAISFCARRRDISNQAAMQQLADELF